MSATRSRLVALGVALLAAVGLGAPRVLHADPQGPPGIFVLGVDGMDPVILQRLMDEGKAPNLAKLAREGSFQSLGTANPPQSPVAWSNFVTGMDPGGHGIFDFIHRDPATYAPISSATPPPEAPGAALHFFGYYLPLSQPELVNNRGGTPFWDLLTDAGVDVEVYRIPGNFPSPPSDAKVLSGMGTVDVRGGYGTYTLYTSKPLDRSDPKGDIQLVTVQDNDLDGTADTVTGILKGPPDVFRLPPGAVPGPSDYLTKRVVFHVDPEFETALVRVDGHDVLLRQGEWSDWVPLRYDALPLGLAPVEAGVRFYAKSLRPDFAVYASPVNISPERPAMAITSPEDWAGELFDHLGFFYTQGMPEDTHALRDGTFDDDDYLSQVALVQGDTRAMLSLALDRFAPGDLTFVYMSDVDLQCHMLWRHGDPKYADAPVHPAMEDDEISARHSHDIEHFYEDVDKVVGEVRSRLPEGSTLVVMSDHGFQPYTRKLHLNSWLRDEGYLVLKDGARTGHIPADVDWSKTRVYGLGFNGLYLNLAGREAQGIVAPEDAGALMTELSDKLTALVDPANERHAVLEVVRTADAYHGDRKAEAPDLIVGYDAGYGCSDESTLGEVVEGQLEDNVDRWSGNHLMSPRVVPGVLLSNRHVGGEGHGLTDLTVTLLTNYGLPPGPGMTGSPIPLEAP